MVKWPPYTRAEWVEQEKRAKETLKRTGKILAEHEKFLSKFNAFVKTSEGPIVLEPEEIETFAFTFGALFNPYTTSKLTPDPNLLCMSGTIYGRMVFLKKSNGG